LFSFLSEAEAFVSDSLRETVVGEAKYPKTISNFSGKIF
jgi:hypothetical protein